MPAPADDCREVAAHAFGSLIPERSLAPVLVAAAYWFSNSLLVGMMAGLAQRRSIVLLLREHLTGRATSARLGGEEFCALMDGQPPSEVALPARAEDLRVAVSQLRLEEAPDLRVTISIGVARQRLPLACGRALIGRADRALYRAKREGRDRVCLDSAAEAPDLRRAS